MNNWTCNYAASGCNYPEGECSGACMPKANTKATAFERAYDNYLAGQDIESTLTDCARFMFDAGVRAATGEQTPFGYFRFTDNGWVDCGVLEEGAKPLYEHPAKTAQGQQEPVAYLYHDAPSAEQAHPFYNSTLLLLAAQRRPGFTNETPLYTHPAPAQPAQGQQEPVAARFRYLHRETGRPITAWNATHEWPVIPCEALEIQPLYTTPPAAPDVVKELEEAKQSLDFYRRRVEALQSWQSKMRDPERTVVCDIIANGYTLPPENAGDRYKEIAAPDVRELVELLEQALPYVQEGEQFNKPSFRQLSVKIRAALAKQGEKA